MLFAQTSQEVGTWVIAATAVLTPVLLVVQFVRSLVKKPPADQGLRREVMAEVRRLDQRNDSLRVQVQRLDENMTGRFDALDSTVQQIRGDVAEVSGHLAALPQFSRRKRRNGTPHDPE